MEDVLEESRNEMDEEIDLADYGFGHINRQNIEQYYKIVDVVISWPITEIDRAHIV